VDREPGAMALTQDDLRIVGTWALGCVERALPVFEAHVPSDRRPREALDGLRAFADGGKRTAQLRSLALAAFTAAREAGDPAAGAAARAAGLAAAVAYTHALWTPDQEKHTLGPAAYSASALELAAGGDPGVGDAEVRWALEHASADVCAIVSWWPARDVGRGRIDALLHRLDAGLRGGPSSRDA
jgi:hypothetical protein